LGVQEQQDVHQQPNRDENSGLVMLVELWRSDLVTSVVELDSEGNVMNTADQQVLGELYPPGKGTGRDVHNVALQGCKLSISC
jgi:hypothetical protein